MNFKYTLALSALALAGCAVKPAPAQILPDKQTAQPVTGLRELADKRGLLLGTSVEPGLLLNNSDNGQYESVLKQNFNMVESGNEFKPPAIWKARETFDFGPPDLLLGAPGKTGWVQANNMTIRCHTLIYGRDDGWTLPDWLIQTDAQGKRLPGRPVNKAMEQAMTKAEAAGLLKKYIFAVAGRYKGKVAQWDVINETIDDNGNNKNPYRLRDSFWFRKLGPEFVEMAFRWAHEADPQAKLYYNDYGIEGIGGKSDAAFALIKDLKAKGVPIDGLGLQWHIGISHQLYPGDTYYQNAQRLQDAGIDFAVTEFDVAMPVVVYDGADPRYGLEPSNTPDLFEQGRLYRNVMQYALSFPNCTAVNLWGFTDKHSWIPGFTIGRLKRNPPGIPQGAATLFDANYQPKPAFWQLREELLHNPTAPLK